MRQFITALLFGCVFCGAVSAFAQTTSYLGEQAPVKKEEKKEDKLDIECGSSNDPMRVVSFATNPPFGWMDFIAADKYATPVGIGKGFGVDLVQDAADKIGLYVRPQAFQTYQEALRALTKGEVDLFVGGYYDTSFIRSGNIFVTPSFFQNVVVPVFMQGKEKEVNSYDDLVGLTGVVRTDEIFYSLIYRGLPQGLTIRQVDSAEEAFRLLVTGEVDYLLGSPYAIEAESRRFKVEDRLVYGKKSLSNLELFLVFSGQSKCLPWRQKLSESVQAIAKDKAGVRNRLMDTINDWGHRFAKEKGILDIIAEEQNPPAEPADTADTQPVAQDKNEN